MSWTKIFPPKSQGRQAEPHNFRVDSGERRATGQKCWRIYGTSLSRVAGWAGVRGEEGEGGGDSN